MTAIVIEDGSGVAGADAYVSISAVSTYVLDHYGAAAQATWDAQAEPDRLVRLGSKYVDQKYHPRWLGTRAHETQGMDHPRLDQVDTDGYVTASTVVHQAVQDAASEASYRAQTVTLFPDESTPGELEAEALKVGSVSISSKFVSGQSALPRFSQIERILAPILGRIEHERS